MILSPSTSQKKNMGEARPCPRIIRQGGGGVEARRELYQRCTDLSGDLGVAFGLEALVEAFCHLVDAQVLNRLFVQQERGMAGGKGAKRMRTKTWPY